MMTRNLLGLVLLFATFAHADTQKNAQTLYEEGVSLYEQGDYEQAIYAFEKADQTVPSGVLEYNVGLCHEKMGNKQAAVNSYRNYLRRAPSAPNKEKVSATILRLDGEIRAEATAKPLEPTYQILGEEPPPVVTGGTTPRSAADVNLDEVAAERSQYFENKPAAIGNQHLTYNGQPAAASGQPQKINSAPFEPVSPGPKKDKPVYKKWWFWVGVGVGVVAAVYILSPGDSGPDSQPVSGGGATLLRF